MWCLAPSRNWQAGMARYGVVLFRTSSSAMQAEALLVKANVPAKLIPTPRQLSSDCGLSLRFDWDAHEQVEMLLRKARVETAGIHELA